MNVRRPISRRPGRLACLATALLLASCTSLDRSWQAAWTPGSFEGWHTRPGGTWEWQGNVLVGRSQASEPRHGLLVTDATYSDFEAELLFRVRAGDSGFYFRTEEVAGRVGVHGFQAEVDRTLETGGLYETGGRAWVTKPKRETMELVYHPGEWTRLRVLAVEGDIDVFVNDECTASLRRDPGRREGHIALQLHGGQEMYVEFRDLRIRRFPPR